MPGEINARYSPLNQQLRRKIEDKNTKRPCAGGCRLRAVAAHPFPPFITRNIAVMEKFDLIPVLKNNRVLEQGMRERLLEQKGRYCRLYQR
jgi:hypothetical protein